MSAPINWLLQQRYSWRKQYPLVTAAWNESQKMSALSWEQVFTLLALWNKFLSLEIAREQCYRQTVESYQPFYWLVYTLLCDPLPLSVGSTCGFLLTKRIWERWWDVTALSGLCYMAKMTGCYSNFTLQLKLSFWVAWTTGPCWRSVGRKELQGSFRNWEWPLEIESSFHLTITKNT